MTLIRDFLNIMVGLIVSSETEHDFISIHDVLDFIFTFYVEGSDFFLLHPIINESVQTIGNDHIKIRGMWVPLPYTLIGSEIAGIRHIDLARVSRGS